MSLVHLLSSSPSAGQLISGSPSGSPGPEDLLEGSFRKSLRSDGSFRKSLKDLRKRASLDGSRGKLSPSPSMGSIPQTLAKPVRKASSKLSPATTTLGRARGTSMKRGNVSFIASPCDDPFDSFPTSGLGPRVKSVVESDMNQDENCKDNMDVDRKASRRLTKRLSIAATARRLSVFPGEEAETASPVQGFTDGSPRLDFGQTVDMVAYAERQRRAEQRKVDAGIDP
eukprot:Hpha_TRINITY_DN31353_c0_g1::TRINITY_DN31353_c0_g1_i1::g.194534::m.194534